MQATPVCSILASRRFHTGSPQSGRQRLRDLKTTFLVLGLSRKRTDASAGHSAVQHRSRLVAEWQRCAESGAAKDVNGVQRVCWTSICDCFFTRYQIGAFSSSSSGRRPLELPRVTWWCVGHLCATACINCGKTGRKRTARCLGISSIAIVLSLPRGPVDSSQLIRRRLGIFAGSGLQGVTREPRNRKRKC